MKKNLVVCVGLALSATQVMATSSVADGRGTAMGGVGVASADYLSGAFVNPALTALYRNNDDFGLLLPSVGISVNDPSSSIDTLDELEGLFKKFESDPTQANSEKLNSSLDNLQQSRPAFVTAGAGVAISIPSDIVSANLFARGYANVVAIPKISSDSDVTTRYNNSTVDLIGFSYREVGLAFAKDMTLYSQKIAFGISPKYQMLSTYNDTVSVNDFDIKDYDKSELEADGFNFDLGAVWHHKHYQVGLAIKDVLGHKMKAGINHSYEMSPKATVGAAYKHRFFTVATDLDLTKQGHFTNIDDDTQYIRFGAEFNGWDWMQLRAGIEHDIEGTYDTAFTGGVGLSPFDIVNLDLGCEYAGEDQYGATASLSVTF
ncbi:conjugal transfer protein TraF [Vibrio sp. 10N.261.46.E12]|uniref:conjugal transfer protein TraF n=1 Tax=unclassified Vibrio TaxID=2614977 RepID=UPI000975D38F|nr:MULTISPECIES: conjugal transfer protein TraF [unclassified Vibrio]OMO36117.1 hypothetical protein BH584_04905 [Vibrio sp. 10N.261.45.E1]PMJ34531.1 hypothetical protein BCU27_03630 [Vibrio sp. 10N.286.45.B6]PML88059.1 hypothetical protein BCT66_10700 [Vibrio sp. 10N.261.49.E11]PMM67387.1 hypothetical protein BCT48_15170 [Vibrio sp. 10N.261.46.F12]PMM81730.1 hypothetical protein BCT46_15085 [Vibrio sp. 10N.261.46.E8]